MRRLMLGMAAAAAAVLPFGGAAEAEWGEGGAGAPGPPSPAMGPFPATPALGPFPATPAFHNQTIRQFLRLSAAGRAVRVRLTNAYGEAPLAIGAARIAILDPNGRERPG